MNKENLLLSAKKHMHFLCETVSDRRVGGPGNIEATQYLKTELQKLGWETTETPLQVIDWENLGATLQVDNNTFEVEPSPYAKGCSIEGELIAIENIEQLRREKINGKIVLLHGEICKEQLMPKNFIFFNPDEHKEIIQRLEDGDPLALICATGHNPQLAGGLYPFPLFEDGDFDIPSVFMKDTEGDKLMKHIGQKAVLNSTAHRIPSEAINIIGVKKGTTDKRIIVSAHVDAKIGTPGAIDNATGVSIMLLLAEMLSGFDSKNHIELAFFNGEDYYSVPGQMKYIEQNNQQFNDVILNINIDGAGYNEGLSAFSPFNLDETMDEIFKELFASNPKIIEGIPWYQGDHSIFLQYGVPAIAVSSSWFIENMETQTITHTPSDNLSIVDYDRLPECAVAIEAFIKKL